MTDVSLKIESLEPTVQALSVIKGCQWMLSRETYRVWDIPENTL